MAWSQCMTTIPRGLLNVKLIEPPCTERYARWCERSANQLMISLLLDYIFIEKTSCVIYWKRKNDCDSRVPERAAKGCLKRKSGWNDSMTRCGQSATFCGIFQCWCCLPGHICILQFDWALFKGSCRMDCAEACPLPDQEGCHPMKHCQPPWRRQSEPEISSEFRVQLRSEDPGRFSGAGSVAFSGWRPAMRKACCPQRAGKSGQTEAFMADRCM